MIRTRVQAWPQGFARASLARSEGWAYHRSMLTLLTFLAAVAIFGALYVAAGAVFFGLSCAFDWVAGTIRDAWHAHGRHTGR